MDWRWHVSFTSHNHRVRKKFSNESGARKRRVFELGSCSLARARSFIAKSAAT